MGESYATATHSARASWHWPSTHRVANRLSTCFCVELQVAVGLKAAWVKDRAESVALFRKDGGFRPIASGFCCHGRARWPASTSSTCRSVLALGMEEGGQSVPIPRTFRPADGGAGQGAVLPRFPESPRRGNGLHALEEDRYLEMVNLRFLKRAVAWLLHAPEEYHPPLLTGAAP